MMLLAMIITVFQALSDWNNVKNKGNYSGHRGENVDWELTVTRITLVISTETTGSFDQEG